MSLCFETSWLVCYAQVRAACVDFGCLQPFLPLHNSSPGLSGRMRVAGESSLSITITHTCRHVTGVFLQWKELSSVSRMLQTECRLPWHSWEYGWERLQVGSLWTFWIRLLAPAWQAPISGSHASTLALSATVCVCVRVCVTALPFLPSVEPPVPGMFHPSQRCFQDAHPEQ